MASEQESGRPTMQTMLKVAHRLAVAILLVRSVILGAPTRHAEPEEPWRMTTLRAKRRTHELCSSSPKCYTGHEAPVPGSTRGLGPDRERAIVRKGWLTFPAVALLVAALSCSSGAPGEGGTGENDVPVAGGNAARNGVYPGPTLDGAPELLWKTQVPGGGLSPAIVVDGTVYALSYEGGWLTALDAKTGTERWQTQIEGWMPSTPGVADGVVYVHGAENLYALDAADGSERWRAAVKAGRRFSSPVVVEGAVYVGGEDGNIYALDALTGAERWRFQVAEDDAGPVAVVDGVVYADGDPNTWALDAKTGQERWHFPKSKYTAVSTPAVANGRVFLGTTDFLHTLDAAKGEEIWHAPSGNDLVPPPAVANGLAFFPKIGDFDQLSALDVETGAARWVVQTDDYALGQPAVVDDTLYVGGNSLYAVKAKTGEELWQFDLETTEKIDGAIMPTPAGGVIYAAVCLDLAYESGCEEGNSYVYALLGSGKPFEGAKTLSLPTPAPTFPPPFGGTPPSTLSVRNPNATPPVLIDSLGTWTLRDLGYSDLWLDRSNGTVVELERPPISRRYSDPVLYLLPAGASQGPDLWYKLHFHFEVIVSDDVNAADKGYQQFKVLVEANSGANVMVDFSTVWQGDRLVLECKVGDCPATQKRENDRVTASVEMWYRNDMPNVGIAAGVNALRFVIPYKDLPPRFQALHVFDDTFIEVTATPPY
jgi:outer membrane protein assembly factor BamB